MKKVLLVMLAVSVFGSVADCYGQASAIAMVSASVVAPIGLVKTVDMSFGNAAVSTAAGGSIVLAPSGARTTGGSGVTLPSTSGTVAAAGFTVSGAPGFTFAVTLPASAIISGPGSSTMTVSGFTSTPSVTGTLSSGGTQALTVGATLNISAAQAPGNYTNATAIPVTVNYN